ncbi:hypothetical protein FGBNBECL_00197 [Enterococcus phage vB_OCPT_Bob]|uniref:Uncharacterized protein n=1 Tax=Enterococcus phage vB_OCPT_Bob TaxID=2922318 RepID=A0A9E7J1V8_9CAUD|nr:hypothetical protein FGBNBECL_00197 [Enterococcus phage vB_OCPT_Bob]
MKLRCTDNNGYVRWTTGGVYEVKKTDEGVLYIEDVEGGCRSYIDAILSRLNHNDESAIFEVIEEKPVRFAKVTCVYPPDRGLIEVGHCYKVLKEFPEGRVRIYLNSKLGNHVLLPDQFVFVDEPSNEGKDYEINLTSDGHYRVWDDEEDGSSGKSIKELLDVINSSGNKFELLDEAPSETEPKVNHGMTDLEKIEAKITALSEESFQLFEKSEELSARAIELQDESVALEEALYTIKQYL